MKPVGQCRVEAKIWWGSTGITLDAGHDYHMDASGEWCDADIHCGADGYDVSQLSAWKRPLFLAVGFLRPLDTGDRWYMLLGRIGPAGPIFEISTNLDLKPTFSGLLYCTVNDLRWAYVNNSGSVSLEVFENGT